MTAPVNGLLRYAAAPNKPSSTQAEPTRTIRHVDATRPLFLLAILCLTSAVSADEIDWNRARELHRRASSGQTLTDEERAYYDRARAERSKQQGRTAEARPESRTFTGLVPLTDMAADDRYKSEDGGLYGGGRNEPPPEHLVAAMEQARQIQTLNAQGEPSIDGKIVLISIGMSNTTQEFSAFQQLARADGDVSPKLVIVDGAQGGMDARAWAQPEQVDRKGRPEPWVVLERRLEEARVTAEQVQVAWLKQALINPGGIGEHPKHTAELAKHTETILHTLKQRFPNLRIVYLSSRIYAGYAMGSLNPEPYAYESAFAVRQLIQRQMKGEPSLNYDQSKGEVRAPLLLGGRISGRTE